MKAYKICLVPAVLLVITLCFSTYANAQIEYLSFRPAIGKAFTPPSNGLSIGGSVNFYAQKRILGIQYLGQDLPEYVSDLNDDETARAFVNTLGIIGGKEIVWGVVSFQNRAGLGYTWSNTFVDGELEAMKTPSLLLSTGAEFLLDELIGVGINLQAIAGFRYQAFIPQFFLYFKIPVN